MNAQLEALTGNPTTNLLQAIITDAALGSYATTAGTITREDIDALTEATTATDDRGRSEADTLQWSLDEEYIVLEQAIEQARQLGISIAVNYDLAVNHNDAPAIY